MSTVGLLLFSAFVWANGGNVTPPEGETLEEAPPVAVGMEAVGLETLDRLIGMAEEAMRTGDFTPLVPHLDVDFSAVTEKGEEVWGLQGIDARRKAVAGEPPRVSLERQGYLFEGTALTAWGEATAQGADGARESHRWTADLRLREGSWKVLRVQVTPVQRPKPDAPPPPDRTLFFGLAGLGGGLLLGLILGLLLRGGSKPKAPPSLSED